MYLKIVFLVGIAGLLQSSHLSAIIEPKMAMDTNGNTIVVFSSSLSVGGSGVYAKSRPAGGSWSSPTLLSTTTTADHPKIAIVANGSGDAQAVSIWTEYDEDSTYLYGAMLTSMAGSWTTATKISVNTQTVGNEFYVSLSNPEGATAVWTSFDEFGNASLSASTAPISSTNTWPTTPTALWP